MRGFKVVNFGELNHGKTTFSERMLFDIRAEESSVDIGHRFFYTNNARVHLMDAPADLESFGLALGALLSADHINLIVDVTSTNTEKTFFFLKLALKLCAGRASILINKMDKVGWSEEAFNDICGRIRAHVVDEDQLRIEYIPIAATTGDNIFSASPDIKWYAGETVYQLWKKSLLSQKRAVKKTNTILSIQNAFPFNDLWVVQGHLFQGRIRKGDFLTTMPGREKVHVEKLYLYDVPEDKVEEGHGVTLLIDKPGEGQFLVQEPLDFQIATKLTARLYAWDKEIKLKGEYFVKYFSKVYQCQVETIHSQNKTLGKINEAVVDLAVTPNLTYQRLDQNPKLGTFSLIDPKTYKTMALGIL